MKQKLIIALIIFITQFTSCISKESSKNKNTLTQLEENYYNNPVLPVGAEPWAIFHDGKYYYTQGCEDHIELWITEDITNLRNAKKQTVWIPTNPKNTYHLWGPEIHFINNAWYIYFTADDGNMDNHRTYVIENKSIDPMQGKFVMKGKIITDKDDNWAIHASVFKQNNTYYMIWSGWDHPRINEETQNIYIASMKNPWTLSSPRTQLSKSEFEWERQWINPNGSKTTYAIYVNESPQFFRSKNQDKLYIYYNASGNWTPYYSIGLLSTDSSKNLLESSSWVKSPKPIFYQNTKDSIYAPGSICFIPSPDGTETYFLYHARSIPCESAGAIDSRSPRLQKVDWDKDSFPILGQPSSLNTPFKKPSK